MAPLSLLSAAEARRLRGVLFDLDDTLLDAGALTEAAYGALFRLRESGLGLMAVTGRPSSWGKLIARQWPVLAAITENGAVIHHHDGVRVVQLPSRDEAQATRNAARLAQLVAELRRHVPTLQPSDDAGERLGDYTFDVGEYQQPDEAEIARAIAIAAAHGAHWVRSSVHLHVSFEGDDKASGALRALQRIAGEDPTRALGAWAFIGDSGNDAACFAAFHTTIGVANLRGRFSRPPRFLTRARAGAGFAEAAATLGRLRA